MARRTARPAAPRQLSARAVPAPLRRTAAARARVAYHDRRTVATLDGLYDLVLVVRRCRDPACPLVSPALSPGGGGRLGAAARRVRAGRHRAGRARCATPSTAACPRSTSALVARGRGHRRAQRHQPALPLRGAGGAAAGRPGPPARARWPSRSRSSSRSMGCSRMSGTRCCGCCATACRARCCWRAACSAAPRTSWCRCCARSPTALPVPIRGVISDGQESIRNAVRTALPDVPHQLCQFHYLREAAKPIFAADRHAKVLLKKEVRGVRPIERALEGRDDAEAEACGV